MVKKDGLMGGKDGGVPLSSSLSCQFTPLGRRHLTPIGFKSHDYPVCHPMQRNPRNPQNLYFWII